MHVFSVLLLLVLEIYYTTGLTCQAMDEHRGEELKKIYLNCLKRYDGRNSSDRRYSDENSSKEKRKTKGQWDRRDSFGNRDDYAGGDWSMGRGRDRMSSRDEWSNNREERMPSRDRFDGNDMNRRQMDGMGHRPYGSDDFNNNEDPNTQRYNSNNSYGGTQQSRRNKREKSTRNKPKQRATDDSYRNSERSSSENRTRDDGAKACALHCFMEELDMTAEDGIPDKYLVTKVITKNVENGELKDFLQESIDECFQMLYNENIQDKCEFSQHILFCLSDKGKANCDDWKDDTSFK